MTGGDAPARRGSVVDVAAASILATGLGLVTGPFVARALGPGGRGEVAAAGVYAALVALCVSLGVPSAVGHAATRESADPGALLATMARFSAALLVPALALAAAIVAGPLSGLSARGRFGAAVLIAVVPAAVLGNGLNSLLVAEGALGPIARLRLAPAASAAVVTLVLYTVGLLTVATALAVAVVTSLGTSLLGWRLVRLRPAGRVPLSPLIRFGLRAYPAHLAVFATHLMDQAFIVAALGARPLGHYAVAVTISSAPNSVGLAVYSRYFAIVASESSPGARSVVISEALRLTLLGAGLVSAAIAVVSPALLPLLYGEAFSRSLVPLFVLLPGTVVFCVSMVGESFLTAMGRPGRATVAEMTGFVLTCVGLPFVVPRFGIVGASVLSSVSYALVMAVTLAFLRQAGPLSLRLRRHDVTDLGRLLRRSLTLRAGRRAGASDDESARP